MARGTERGYVTHDEINAVLPTDQTSSEQTEDMMTMLSDLGINFVNDKDADSTASGVEDGADMRGNIGEDAGRKAHRGRPRDDDRRPL